MSIADTVVSTANKYGVPSDLALAVATQESGLRQDVTSSAGAIGVMQLMPSTASYLGVDPYNAEQNIEGGMKYLSQLFRQFGDWALALAAYNAGPGNVAKYGGVPPFKETQNYVTSILSKIGVGTDPTTTSVDVVDNGETGSVSVAGSLGIAVIAGVIGWWVFFRG